MNYMIWIIIYLIFATIFSQEFKVVNRVSKNISALTILLEIFTAIFALILSIFFEYKFPSDIKVYITLLIVTIIYAITDRLNIEARYGLKTSTFSMLKQLSTVFMVIFGIFLLKEEIVLKKIIGSILIIFANILLARDKSGNIVINKYFIMSFISNFLFAVAMLINVNISTNFNIGIYTFATVFIPSMIIKIFSKLKIKELKDEFNLYDKKKFLLVAFSWCVMLISSVKAYECNNISVVAPLLTLTSIINTFYEYIKDKKKDEFINKLVISIIILVGVLLIKI